MATHEITMSIVEDIDLLETKISKLKVEYEQYFLRVIKKQPIQLREEIDRLVNSYHGRAINNSTHKFRLNNLIAKYNTYRNYWNRTLRAIEEGTYHRQAEGGMGMGGITPPPSTAPARPRVEDKTEQPATLAAAPRPAAAEQPQRQAAPASNPTDDIYSRYMAARKECNEATAGISRESLAKSLEDYKKKIMLQYNAKDVEVRVAIKDGKSKLLIVPKK